MEGDRADPGPDGKGDSFMTAKLEGKSWKDTHGAFWIFPHLPGDTEAVGITGYRSSGSEAIYFIVKSSLPGTYKLKAFDGMYQNQNIGEFYYVKSGTVKITESKRSGIEGTFSLVLSDYPGEDDEVLVTITDGKFKAIYVDDGYVLPPGWGEK